MKTVLKSGMFTSLGLAGYTLAKTNDALETTIKSLRKREFEGQIIYGILKGKSLEYLGQGSQKLLNGKIVDDELVRLDALNFSLEDLDELWQA